MRSQFVTFALFAATVLAVPIRRLENRAGRIIQRDSPTISYYGGPLILKPEVHSIYYGAYPTDTIAKVQQFYSFLTKSAVMELLIAEYSVPGKKISYGSVAIPLHVSTNVVNWLDDKNYTRLWLRDLVVSGRISPTENTYYPIHLPQGVNASLGAAVACVDFCGYHGTIDISDIPTAKTKYLYYAIIPDQSGWCMGGCGESPDPFQNICGVSTHEFAEAVTNPAISVATGLAPPVGWYAAGFGEIGDLCTMMEGKLTDPITNNTWTVDRLWSKSHAACIVPNTSPKDSTKSLTSLTETTVSTKQSKKLTSPKKKSTTTTKALTKAAKHT